MAVTTYFDPAKRFMQQYLPSASSLIMQHLANGSVSVTTLEALCLLSYAYFLGMSQIAPKYPCSQP